MHKPSSLRWRLLWNLALLLVVLMMRQRAECLLERSRGGRHGL